MVKYLGRRLNMISVGRAFAFAVRRSSSLSSPPPSALVHSLLSFTPNQLNDLLNGHGGVQTALRLRGDISKMMKIHSSQFPSTDTVKRMLMLEEFVISWLKNVFCYDALYLKQIEYDTSSGALLDAVMKVCMSVL